MSNRDHKRSKARQERTTSSNLPVLVSLPRQRPSLFRHQVPAHFLSQLIVARNAMAVQLPKKRRPVNVATSAYSSGKNIVRRSMPAGYGHAESV